MVDFVRDYLLKHNDENESMPFLKAVNDYANDFSKETPLYVPGVEMKNTDNISRFLSNYDAAMKLRNKLAEQPAEEQPTEEPPAQVQLAQRQQPQPTIEQPAKMNFQPQSKQEAEFRQAEQDLQEAKEADKQSGSEGYEAKEDGVFNRLKSWGSSVSDYLFGKGIDPNSDEGREAEMLQELAAEEKRRLLDKYGVLGYYGGGALGSLGALGSALIGKQGKQEWNDFKKDFGERGIGAFTQRANNLMEDMARSPFSKFVDPTTLLGGQRTMVNDIDRYFNQQGLPALRNELLAQDMERMKTDAALKQTKWGQFQDYLNSSPDVQAAYRDFAQAGKALSGYKNLQEAAVNFPSDLTAELGREPSVEEIADEWGKRYTVPYAQALLSGRQASQNAPKTLSAKDQLAYDQAERDVARNPENYLGDTYEDKLYDAFRKRQQEAQYQAQTPEVEQVKGFAKEYPKIVGEKLKEVDSPEYNKTMLDLLRFYEFLNDPDTVKLSGGAFNKVIRNYASVLGYSGAGQDEFLASFLQAQRGMHATAIRQINQQGATNAEEQRSARESIIDLNKSYDYNKQMVEQTISNMALAQALVKDEYYLAARGGAKEVNDKAIREKYKAMLRNPKVFIDPDIIDAHLGEAGVFGYSPSQNTFVFGREE